MNNSSNNTFNIIVVGKTGSGKSTICNALLYQHFDEQKIFATHDGFKSGTTKTELISRTPKNKQNIKFNICDAVGFFDTEDKDKITLKDLQNYIKNQYNGELNVIIFVLHYGKFTQEEKNALTKLYSIIEDKIKIISLLIITHCDDFNKTKRDTLIANFINDNLTKDYAKRMNEIITIGIKNLKDFENDDTLKMAYEVKGNNDALNIQNIIIYNYNKKYKLEKGFCDDILKIIE